jgi:hypothetical protein
MNQDRKKRNYSIEVFSVSFLKFEHRLEKNPNVGQIINGHTFP